MWAFCCKVYLVLHIYCFSQPVHSCNATFKGRINTTLILSYLDLFSKIKQSGCKYLEAENTQDRNPPAKIWRNSTKLGFHQNVCTHGKRIAVTTFSWGGQLFCRCFCRTRAASWMLEVFRQQMHRRLLLRPLLLYQYIWFIFSPNSFWWPVCVNKLLQSLESRYRGHCKPSIRQESADPTFYLNRRGSSVAKRAGVSI